MNEFRPFRRNLTIDPFVIPISMTPTPMHIGKSVLDAKGVTSFKISNPNPFWVWYRGWNGNQAQMPTIEGMGHFIAPGATEINSSQIPDWIAAMPSDEPGFPIFDANGAYLYEGKRTRLVMLYGGGS